MEPCEVDYCISCGREEDSRYLADHNGKCRNCSFNLPKPSITKCPHCGVPLWGSFGIVPTGGVTFRCDHCGETITL